MNKHARSLTPAQVMAAKLAPIICAFAAGSQIQYKHEKGTAGKWQDLPEHGNHIVTIAHIAESGYDVRIAPKPPKAKQARIALMNCAVDGGGLEGLEGQVKEEAKIHEGWIPARIIVPKGRCESVSKHPAFVKWVSELFTISG